MERTLVSQPQRKIPNVMQPLILCHWKTCLPVTNMLILAIRPIALHCYWHQDIFKCIYCQYKVPQSLHRSSLEHFSTAVTKVMLKRVISHNSSQMDSPEIKSASQTASWGGNIPLQFFIDLHSFSPWYFPCFAPPSLSSLPSLPCPLGGFSLCVWWWAAQYSSSQGGKVWNNTLTHISSPQIGILQAFCFPLLNMCASEKR